MKRNRVIYKVKFIPNIEGWENYHISRRGRLYRYYPNRRVWMVLNGTISRGRIYHILRNGQSQIKSLNNDYISGVDLRLIKKRYRITHVHRYLYSNTKLRRNVVKRALDKP